MHQKRGYNAHEPQLLLLHNYRGWLIHDFYSFYFRFVKAKHGACNAHVLRELKTQSEAGRSWAKKFRNYRLSLYEKTEQGTEKLLKKEQEKAMTKYRQLLKAGYKEEPTQLAGGAPKTRKEGTFSSNWMKSGGSYWLSPGINASPSPIILLRGIFALLKPN